MRVQKFTKLTSTLVTIRKFSSIENKALWEEGPSHIVYIHVTVHRNRFIFIEPKRRTDYPYLFCYKTLHVSSIFFAHHQEFSTVHSALVSFMQGFDDRFQAESGWNCISIPILLGNGHQKPAWNLPVPNVQSKTPDDGQRRCSKHVEFYNGINLDNQCVWLGI
jgi:hypothetical protein